MHPLVIPLVPALCLPSLSSLRLHACPLRPPLIPGPKQEWVFCPLCSKSLTGALTGIERTLSLYVYPGMRTGAATSTHEFTSSCCAGSFWLNPPLPRDASGSWWDLPPEPLFDVDPPW